MFFLNKIWRGIKLSITGIGGIIALAMLIAGIVIGAGIKSTIIIIGGSIFIVQSGLLFFDNSVGHAAIHNHLENLETEIGNFQTENNHLRGNIREFITTNKKLCMSIKETEKQLLKLTEIKDQYQQENKNFQELINKERNNLLLQEQQIKVYQTENEEFKTSINNMNIIQNNFIRERTELSSLLEKNKNQIIQLEAIKTQALNEINQLQSLHHADLEKLGILESQVNKLKQLYTNSLELLDNLRKAGDMFTSFEVSIGNNVSEIQSVSNSLEQTQAGFDQTLSTFQNLITKLKASTFQKLDINTDGVITSEEFNANINNL